MSGVGLVAFLGVLAGGAVVPITDTPPVGPAVAGGVGALLGGGIPAASAAAPTALPLLGCKVGLEGLDLVGQVREELVETSCLRTALLLVAALARLSRALSMVQRKLVAWLSWAPLKVAWLARPKLSAPPVAQRQVALNLWASR